MGSCNIGDRELPEGVPTSWGPMDPDAVRSLRYGSRWPRASDPMPSALHVTTASRWSPAPAFASWPRRRPVRPLVERRILPLFNSSSAPAPPHSTILAPCGLAAMRGGLFEARRHRGDDGD